MSVGLVDIWLKILVWSLWKPCRMFACMLRAVNRSVGIPDAVFCLGDTAMVAAMGEIAMLVLALST
jgi:hypothetical protein